MAETRARTLLSDLERKTTAGRIAGWTMVTLLFLGMLTTLLPLLWTLFSVVKEPKDIFTVPPTLFPHPLGEPSQWRWKSWAAAWEHVDFPLHFFNSAILVVGIWALQIIPSALAAYAMSVLPTRGAKIVAFGFFLTLLVPFQVIVIPLYLTVRHLDLVPYAGRMLGEEGAQWLTVFSRAILPAGCSAFNIFVFKSFFDQLPRDLFEAARIDGASERTIFWKLVLPLSTSILAVASIFTIINTWNDFLWPYLIFGVGGNTEWQPIMVRLYFLEGAVDNSTVLAALVLSALPPLFVFLIFQRKIMSGVALTGLKG